MLEANNQGENQIFLYEVVFSGSSGSLPQRFSRTVLRVPKSRMSQETQRLLRQGAKILSIRPIDPETASIKPSLLSQPWWIEITTKFILKTGGKCCVESVCDSVAPLKPDVHKLTHAGKANIVYRKDIRRSLIKLLCCA